LEQREENQIIDNEINLFKKLSLLTPASFLLLQHETLVDVYLVSLNETFCVLKALDFHQQLYNNNNQVEWISNTGVEFIDFCVLTSFEAKTHPKYNRKYYEQASKELERFGYIKGYELLSLSTMKKFWVSHYDLIYFEDI